MPTKKSNGNGHDVQHAILEALHTLHADIVQTNSRLDVMNQRLGRVEDAVVQMNGRFDHFLETAGEHARAQGARIDKLEARMERIESSHQN